MPTIKQLEEQGRALLNDQKALVNDESRPWSEKRDEYDRREADIKAVLDQHTAMKAVAADPFGPVDKAAEVSVSKPQTVEEQIIGSKTYRDALAAKSAGERFAGAIDLKAAATITQAGGGAGTVVPEYRPGIVPTLFRRLTVAQLMPNTSISSPTLIYMQETAVTNGAATVAEGALKPPSDITIAQKTENVRKIATTAKISDEMLQDASYIAGYVQGRLVLFVQLAEEDQLLNGNGTAPNLTGLLQRSGLATAVAVPGTPTANDRPNALYGQISAIRANSFLEPDGIIMHPTDWKTIRLSTDANNQYFGGGPFTGAYGNGSPVSDSGNLGENPDLWGCRVVVTPAITQGTALVGAFGVGAQVFRRTGITVEMTNSNEDDFKNNLVALRAEERLALAVYRPGAFGKVTAL